MTSRFLFVFDQHDPWERSIQSLVDLAALRHSQIGLLETSASSDGSLALLAARLSMMGQSTLGAWLPQFDRSQLASYAKSQGASCVVLLEQEFPRNLSQRQQRLLLEKTGLEVIILPREKPLVSRESPLVSREKPLVPRESPLVSREKPLVSRESPALAPSQLAREPFLRQKVLV